MNVVITGSSGLIGSALMPRLSRNGHTIRRLVRGARAEGAARWNPDDGSLDESPLAGADAVVHLAGETIATGRWTAARKARIRDRSEERRVGKECSAREGLDAKQETSVSVTMG